MAPLPYTARYALYGGWKTTLVTLHPTLRAASLKTTRAVRYVMQRLSKDNLKKFGRVLGRLSHGNPAALFDSLLAKVQVYDNFIQPVVDALKYANPLGLDVLAFCLVEALANPEKARMQVGAFFLRAIAIAIGAAGVRLIVTAS